MPASLAFEASPSSPRGQKHEACIGEGGVGLDLSCEVYPIHPGHVHVQDRHVVRVLGLHCRSQRVQCAPGVFRAAGPHTPREHVLVDDPTVRGVVVHHQHSQALQVVAGPRGGTNRLRLLLERDLEPERGADPRLALQTYLASHELHQLLRDGEPESRATVAPRSGGVCLGERLEETRALLLVHADTGVRNLEADPHARLCLFRSLDAQHDLSLLGELRRVAYEVDQDLGETAGIPPERIGYVVGHQVR